MLLYLEEKNSFVWSQTSGLCYDKYLWNLHCERCPGEYMMEVSYVGLDMLVF